ncbi:periplasmic nitrate reductase, NapE protein [Rhizobium sp. LCM 4573]|uniref:periplasmic nitrate reductase, NapE protein n=1 Tax=Rhizobium sp. LCM 4573 TaxID=1848291 RepID=UPI0008D9636A|nr:nitrate reductase [Rhizobium sp. LCM 4573]OHV76921.1 nitrate reductase [Rhizobium sp. LCM 4573]
MTDVVSDPPSPTNLRSRRRNELLAFFALAFGVWPSVAIGVVGSYGFLVWFYQMIFGPPGPPMH